MTFRFILILLIISGTSRAQISIFHTYEAFCDTCSKDLDLSIRGSQFAKNNEYFTPRTDGFTGIGFILQPQFNYYLSSKTRVNLGAHLLKYSGSSDFTQAIPLYSIEHQFNPYFRGVLGHFYGNLNHQLEEPIFRFDRYYKNNVEYGAQGLLKSKRIDSDIWINWEKYIFPEDPYQEEFSAGSSSQITALLRNNFKLIVPIQAFISHKGGQIDSSPDPAFSVLNGLLGLNLQQKIKNNLVELEYSYLSSKGFGSKSTQEDSSYHDRGRGHYLKLKFKHKVLHCMMGYWNANDFVAPRGELLFQSGSDKNPEFYQSKRELITGKIALRKKVSNSFSMEARLETYYDLLEKDMDYSYGWYFVFNERIFLKNLKSR